MNARYHAKYKYHPKCKKIKVPCEIQIGTMRNTPPSCGHFMLGLDAYTHFTSPIRRYADIVVHRMLTLVVSKQETQNSQRRRALA